MSEYDLSFGMEEQHEMLPEIHLATFQEMGPPTAFLDHLKLDYFWSSKVVPKMIGDPSIGVEATNQTVVVLGGEATAGKTKLASQLFYWIDNNPGLSDTIEKAYLSLATTAHFSRIIKGNVTPDHGHGQYLDAEYNAISDDAFELGRNFLEQPRESNGKHRLLLVEFSSAAYMDQNGQLHGSNRLFTTVKNLVESYREDSYGIFIDQADGVVEANTNFRDEIMAATPDQVSEILERYKMGIVSGGRLLEPGEIDKNRAQEVLNIYRLTSTPRAGVERNHIAFEKTKRELRLKYHPKEDVWWHIGSDPRQLGFESDKIIVLKNEFTDIVLPLNIDILDSDLAYQRLRESASLVNQDPILQAQGVILKAA